MLYGQYTIHASRKVGSGKRGIESRDLRFTLFTYVDGKKGQVKKWQA